jgi:hypothetical protein
MNKFYLLLIKIKDILWHNRDVTSCIPSNTCDTQPKKLTDFFNSGVTELSL